MFSIELGASLPVITIAIVIAIAMHSWIPPEPVKIPDLSFMDARFKLIDLAAFLDRVQRAGQDGDFRVQALKKAIAQLSGTESNRAKKVLLSLSDPSTDPIAKATMQGALGAYQHASS